MHASQELEKLQGNLQKCTRSIIERPYDPAAWLLRAEILLRLGYPELVLGDCYKARLLLEAVEKADVAHDELDQTLAERVKLYVGMQLWLDQYDQCPIPIENWPAMVWQMRFHRKLRELERKMLGLMIRGFSMAQCYYELIKTCRQGKMKFGKDAYFQACLDGAMPTFLKAKGQQFRAFPNGSAVELKEGYMTGFVKMRCYPWIDHNLLRRRPEIISSIKHDFSTASADKCVLRASKIRDKIIAQTGATSTPDVFGAFAAADLEANELILIDNTVAAVLDKSTDRCDCCCCVLRGSRVCLPCCSVEFCTSKCAERARKTYHAAVCGRDLTFFQNASGDGACTPAAAVESLLLLRCLAISVQGPWPHPLQTPIIAQMTASYPRNYQLPYNFQHRTVRPTKMLQLLGVDVFADLNYDTWVLFTIQMRLNNNHRDGGFGVLDSVTMLALNPLQSFLNHSCRPNVTAMPDFVNMSSTSTLRAKRHIHAGEELCVEYTHQIFQPLAVRREALEPWLAADCQCEKCLSEEREMSQARKN